MFDYNYYYPNYAQENAVLPYYNYNNQNLNYNRALQKAKPAKKDKKKQQHHHRIHLHHELTPPPPPIYITISWFINVYVGHRKNIFKRWYNKVTKRKKKPIEAKPQQQQQQQVVVASYPFNQNIYMQNPQHNPPIVGTKKKTRKKKKDKESEPEIKQILKDGYFLKFLFFSNF